ncbi:hypothetical protein GCM10011518_08930 [Flavobacterium limi]|uniref:Knr4/Smi1-like domain-containing protein n=2 Tax=Flavobacterium limi TaxID=2045105 RepID=A0ABQ1TTC6_9FLAO|nr:hypothetical protein GCM10011518_08930 [Flavobacterium limi]
MASLLLKSTMKLFNFFKIKSNKTDVQVEIKRSTENHGKVNNPEVKIDYNSSTTLIEVLNFIKDHSLELGIQLNKPATDTDIENLKNIKIELSEDFKVLYKFCNGFETNEDIFRLIPLDEIIENGKDNYLISDHSFHFTEYLIYCDMWSVDINPKNIEEYKLYNKADEVVVLTNSITEFLCVFINKGLYDGLYEWGEEKSNNKLRG